MMLPRVHKCEKLLSAVDRAAVHEMACSFGEGQFSLKGSAPTMWLIGFGARVIWIETNWQSEREKHLATAVVRDFIDVSAAQTYSFLTEAFVTTVSRETMTEAEYRYWREFADRFGVCEMPPHMRDDVLMILSFDRTGNVSVSRYVVQQRQGKGLNYLGPRIDEDGSKEARHWGGAIGNLFARART